MLWPLVALTCLVIGFTVGFAQPQQQTPYWYVSQYQVDFRLTDSLAAMIKLGSGMREELKRTGHLLEERWLLHHTGNEWNVLHIRKYPNWAAVNDQAAATAAMQKAFPDSARRAALNRAWEGIFQETAHRDGIYVEIGIGH
jgi:hypothetical protein